MIQAFISNSPFFVCFFWLLVLVQKPARNTAHTCLCVYMAVCVCLFFCHAAFFNHEYALYYAIDVVYSSTSMAVYPLFYLYIRALTKGGAVWRYGWVLLPTLLFTVLQALLYAIMPDEEQTHFIHQIIFGEPGSYAFSKIGNSQLFLLFSNRAFYALQCVLVVVAGSKLIIDYHRRLMEFYADTEDKRLQKLLVILYVFIFCSLVSGACNFIGRPFFANNPWMLAIPSFLYSGLLFIIGHFGYEVSFTNEDFERDLQQVASLEKEVVIPSSNQTLPQELAQRLKHLIEEETLFKQADLRISDCVARLHTNRTYLSQVINQQLQTSFSDLINTYRIDYAKQLMRQYEELSLKEIGEMAGFSGDSSFYRAFKKAEGVPPGEWRHSATKRK